LELVLTFTKEKGDPLYAGRLFENLR
jgi:hypothetical protein